MKKTIEDYNINGKRVIIRCDFNVPIKDGVILDDTRIRASLKTIKYAIEKKARVILLSHLGKIKEVGDLEKNNLEPVSEALSKLLGIKVLFSNETRGNELENMVKNLQDGNVLLVQNTRYEDLDGNKESSCDVELSRYWANLGDIFINDAYGTLHRAHASNVGIARILPNGIGFLVNEEIDKIDSIINDETHPFVVIMGGAKVHDKIKVIKNLIDKCDKILIGGGMAYTFLKVQGINVGKSLIDEESMDFASEMINKYKNKIVLPIDHVVSNDISSDYISIKSNDDINNDEMGLDIGPNTIDLYCNILKSAKRCIINGPMGLFEDDRYSKGTKAIYDYITTNNIKTLIGGGDSVSSVNKLSDAKLFYHISTGGGATLEYLEGGILPGIGVINEK